MDTPRVVGLVLAAGAGTRFGAPKALARDAAGTPWVHLAARMLQDAGCTGVLVALGSRADEAEALVPADARMLVVPDWSAGLSATLRAGLVAAALSDADALLITPVDTPDAPADAARRVIRSVQTTPSRRDHPRSLDRAGWIRRDVMVSTGGAAWARAGLAQAMYGGEPGHPVYLGADHFTAVSASLAGDRGAGLYLRAHGALEVECGDLWSGIDVDRR